MLGQQGQAGIGAGMDKAYGDEGWCFDTDARHQVAEGTTAEP